MLRSFFGHSLTAALSLATVVAGLSLPHDDPQPAAVQMQHGHSSAALRHHDGQNPAAEKQYGQTPALQEQPGNGNAPNTRNLWSTGFDIDTNPYTKWPSTGRVVEYNLTIAEHMCNPDGHGEKVCQLVNGQYPAPTIEANWGDIVRVHVTNGLENNGTSFHWHGIRQLNSCQMDGTNGVTECPIAPGRSRVYEWVATQYGTSWYHSHHTAQYGAGCAGPIIIHGPSTANYDEDLGVLPLADWYYGSIYTLLSTAMRAFGPPPPNDNVLVNGKMVDGFGNGEYEKLEIQAGKTYRLRFVNTAVDHSFHVSLDQHEFTVISADLVPVKPYKTTDLKIHIGQRYDVIFTASQAIANYFLRLRPASDSPTGLPPCGKASIFRINNGSIPVGAIVSYKGAPDGLPKSTPFAQDGTCNDETFIPYHDTHIDAKYGDFIDVLNVTSPDAKKSFVHWTINGTTMDVDWDNPTLNYVRGAKAFTDNMSAVRMPVKEKFYLWVIENGFNPPIPHPIHLHGHDFEVLGSGVGPFPWGKDMISNTNPIRRDVAMLPGSPVGGWLLLGIYTDNPGTWLMHCHIAWHASQGFSMQFIEREDEVISAIGGETALAGLDSGCDSWNSFWHGPNREIGVDEDSGI